MIRTLADFKDAAKAAIQKNQQAWDEERQSAGPLPKVYHIEANRTIADSIFGSSARPLGDAKLWYSLDVEGLGPTIIDTSYGRIWRVFTLTKSATADKVIDSVVQAHHYLDRCWFQRSQLLAWRGRAGFSSRGIGIRFRDGLMPKDEKAEVSLKLWNRSGRSLKVIDELIQMAEAEFAVHSVRWEERSTGTERPLLAEIYSNGKMTVASADDIDEALVMSSEVTTSYAKELNLADKLRRESLASFELEFKQEIDLPRFADAVAGGVQPMMLWLVPTERQQDSLTLAGVDLHTWDRLLLSLSPSAAAVSVPGEGCINAVPRIATIQGEDSGGRTTITFDGNEVFV